MAAITKEHIQKFFVKVNDYCKAYREKLTGKAVIAAVKVYKSHRKA